MIVLVHDKPPKLCDLCSPMAARTRAQLDKRIARMAAHPDVQPYECERCGSTAWATTDRYLPPEDAAGKERQPWGKVLFAFAVVLIAVGVIGLLR